MIIKIVLICILCVFVFTQIIFLRKLNKRKVEPDGLLNVDRRDPEKDYYDFVFLIPTDDIPKKKYLTIEVFVKGENLQGEKF